jgi:hypothetical protein
MPIERVRIDDQSQVMVIGDVNFHFNAEGEFIWQSFNYAGQEFRQQITDTLYTGGTAWTDIVRTITQHEMVRQ